MNLHRWTATVFLMAAAAAASRGGEPAKGESYALLVGVTQYSEAKELRDLAYPERDVTDLARVLRGGGYKADNVVLMTHTAGVDRLRYMPLKKRIQKELKLLLAGRSEGDTLLLAFAGHGVKFSDDAASYFCPADAQLDDKDTLLSLTEVYRQLEGCKAGLKVLLVDACRNDPFASGARAPARIEVDTVTRPPAPTPQGGVVAFFSCSEKEKAYEADKLKHGVFFHFVIEGLKGEAAGDKGGVSVLDLGAYVSRRVHDFVRVEYGANQTPELTGSSRGAAPLARFNREIADLTEALRKDPNARDAYVRRAEAYAAMSDYDDAIADYTDALRLGPEAAFLYRNRARAFNARGAFARAVEDASEALRLDPKFADARFERAWAYASMHEPDKAIADYTEVVRLDARNGAAFNNRGCAYHDKGDADKAIADHSEAIRIDPHFALAYRNRALAYRARGEYDKAIADWTEVIRLEPTDPWAFNNRGLVYRDEGELDKAIADYSEAIRLNPGEVVHYENRSRVYLDKGEIDKAIADRDQADQLKNK